MKKAVIVIVILILSMIGYTRLDPGFEEITGDAVNPIVEIGEKPIVLFCQTDNCMENLIYLVNNSEKIHCALFDLKLDPLIDALKQNNAKVVVDKNYEDEKLTFARYDNNNQLTHNKFCVFDDEIVWTGSFNPTNNGNYKNDNNVVILFSKTLAQNYEDEFQELWNGIFGKGDPVENPIVKINNITVENYFCPDDNCAEHVITALDTAKESIFFMTFSFTHDDIGAKLIEKDTQGININGIFEKRQQSKYSEYDKLLNAGLNVTFDNNPQTMHHKVFIIDEKIVVTGSFNPTMSGDERNDENVLIIHDKSIAEEFLNEFDRISNSI